MSNSVKRRLVYSVVIVVAWFGFLTEGSHALFADSVVLSSNSVISGTTDLLISNSQAGSSTTYADMRPGFNLTLNPGESQERYFLIKNVGSLGVPMDLSVTAGSTDTVTMASSIFVQFVPVDSTGLELGTPVEASLTELLSGPFSMHASVNSGEAKRFKMRVRLNQQFATQNQATSYDLIFNGIQQYAA